MNHSTLPYWRSFFSQCTWSNFSHLSDGALKTFKRRFLSSLNLHQYWLMSKWSNFSHLSDKSLKTFKWRLLYVIIRHVVTCNTFEVQLLSWGPGITNYPFTVARDLVLGAFLSVVVLGFPFLLLTHSHLQGKHHKTFK